MRRVLHVTDVYLPRLGGIEVHLSGLVAEQRRRGVQAEVATSCPSARSADAAAGPPDPAYVHRLAGGPASAVRRLAALVAEHEYDVVHVHVSVWSPFATLAARDLVRRGVPVLVTVHSMWSRLGPLPVLARELLRLRAWPLTWSAVSEAAAAPLREMLGPEIPVAVLGNAVDLAFWRPTSTSPPVEAGRPLRVVSVMRLTRVKRAVPLAQVLHDVRRRVPEGRRLEAVVVGDGPRGEAMRRLLARQGDLGWVRLPGRLDRTGIRTLLAGADVYVAPAELESFGIAALEARTAGVPVVASSLGGVGDFVVPGVNGFLGADDAGLVDGLVRLLTDDDLRRRIALHNATVPPDHGWDLACDRAEPLYDRAAAAARVPARALPLAVGLR